VLSQFFPLSMPWTKHITPEAGNTLFYTDELMGFLLAWRNLQLTSHNAGYWTVRNMQRNTATWVMAIAHRADYKEFREGLEEEALGGGSYCHVVPRNVVSAVRASSRTLDALFTIQFTTSSCPDGLMLVGVYKRTLANATQ